ncbi:hypothetical protein B9Q04_12345, partial [Candidatus Marsarchaeota G2 archaeon BE_D]
MFKIGVEESVERAERDTTNSVVTINRSALAEAERVGRGSVEPFPFGVKDIVYTKGIRTNH